LKILKKALAEDPFLTSRNLVLKQTAALVELAGGDARKMLSILELVSQSVDEQQFQITDDLVYQTVQSNPLLFDKKGEFHYDLISAFIKSVRGSDPNAAVYWLARLIAGGETVEFIARRMLILAAEDIGNANPTALVMANNVFQAVRAVGFPEGRILLSQCAIYLASSPKSNTSYQAINEAQKKVKETGNLAVPLHLRNAPTELMQSMGYGEGYQYAHDYAKNFIEQEFLPDEIKGQKFYQPGDNSKEKTLKTFLKERWGKKYDY